jgi:hypothetical protein
VENEALDLEDDDLADEVGEDVLFFLCFTFLPPLGASGPVEGSAWPGLLSVKISTGSMLPGCSKSAAKRHY